MTILRRIRAATMVMRRNRGTLILNGSPTQHQHRRDRFDSIMRNVAIALLPAAAGGIYLFGIRVALLCASAVLTALCLDWACRRLRGVRYVFDYSPVVTGLLLALSLPAGVPLFFAPLGAAVAIVGAKEVFGGLGRNRINPAITGRLVLYLVFFRAMTTTAWPREGIAVPDAIDSISGATTLLLLKEGHTVGNDVLRASLLGTEGGAAGETGALLILAGAAFLFYRRIISWRIPFSILATMALMVWLDGALHNVPIAASFRALAGHLLGGGVLLAAFFMATDYSSSPSTPLGQLLYGAGIGGITMGFRFFGRHAEGVMFAIFFMNLTVPLINHLTLPRVVGVKKRRTGLTFRWVWGG